MRIGLDAMGGDHAPHEIVCGAVDALKASSDLEMVLVGNEEAIRTELAGVDGWEARVAIEHATQVIGMEESPVESLRQKRDSSISKMLQLASAGKVDAIISAGNTGAFVAGCQLRLGTLAGVSRPGIGVTIPTFHGPLVLCDVGANIAAKPHHLHDYAVMASLYARHVIGIEEPRVALLSIGEEDVKGTELVRQTRALLRNNESIRFVGNVEGQALFAGECEVVVCDGFVGNIVLKLTEGLAEGLFRTIAKEIEDEAPELTRQFEPMVKAIWARHDYSEYGGALLLGVDGVCVICHGRSERRAIANAIRVAAEFGRLKLNSKIVENLGP